MNAIVNVIRDTWDNMLARVSILVVGGGWVVYSVMAGLTAMLHRAVGN